MDILYGNSKIKKLCQRPSKKLQRRLDDLRAIQNLKDAETLPGRLHPLRADRSNQFAIDVDQPYRLIFECANEPAPRTEDGFWELDKITAIRLIELEDYHGN